MAIGILGGRFDPPHVGHLALARAAVEQLGLDELRVTVVADAGHKAAVAPAADRLAMARLAFPDATVELEEHAYTVDALQAYGYDDPYFVVGADQLADLPTWKEPQRVLELARLAVAARPGYAAPSGSDRIVVFELEPQDVSSTEIRERVRAGEPIEGLVVPAVAAYIASRGLYVR
ncbi:MAG TPA: nicotinate-nicotinamide nucleotide adenylyltransferase [Gaiellaceae bacterium]|nr:nicotinate-nicotinamide nucleotide adenylyltransferase [Gaiellaceae bacterium]